MRIGELLLQRRVVFELELELALGEQARSGHGQRLCSLLISRGAVEFDEGARALGDQQGVPCALAKHLANRDPALADAIPAELGRAAWALPIGRTSGGALIVAVRDPASALVQTLEAAVGSAIVMVVTPATRLELLIAASYGASPDEFDIELDSQVDVPVPPREPPPPDVDLLDPDSIRLALSSLDDVRVAKSPDASGSMNIPTRMTRSGLPPVAPTIEATRASLARVESRDAATDAAMAFIAGRWISAIVLTVQGKVARGYRGHGIVGVAELELPLDAPSTIQRVVTTKQLSTSVLASGAQDLLARALLGPLTITAAPILVAGEVIAVLCAGDSIHGVADTAATGELGMLSLALGTAYERIRRG